MIIYSTNQTTIIVSLARLKGTHQAFTKLKPILTRMSPKPFARGEELDRTDTNSEQSAKIGRRSLVAAAVAAVPAAAALGQSRDYGQGAPPVRYPDRDIIALDPRFAKYKINNTPIHRLYTGMLWAEGPAWNGLGRFLVWSDIPNNVASTGGSTRTVTSAPSAAPRTTPTATRSTGRAATSPAITARAASCATSATGA